MFIIFISIYLYLCLFLTIEKLREKYQHEKKNKFTECGLSQSHQMRQFLFNLTRVLWAFIH